MRLETPASYLRYLYQQQPLITMTSFYQRHQILASLDGLDAGQTEKVLEYIRSLQRVGKDESHDQKVKREAMKEIRLALGRDRTLRPYF